MKRLILLGLLAAPALGCTTLKPVGPLTAGKDPQKPSSGLPSALVTAPKDLGAMPTFADAPPPPEPTRAVSAGDVTAAGAHETAKKLTDELDRDRKAADAMPYYSEVSRVPRNGR